MSAIAPCLTVVILRRWSPTRRASSTKNGSSASENSASRQSSSNIATTRRDHRRHVGDDRRGGRGDDALHAADVVGDARLDLARARLGEERQREPLQVLVDLRAQVVHHALADDVGQPGLADAQHPGGDRDADHPADQDEQQLVPVRRGSRRRARPAAGTARPSTSDRRERDQDQDGEQPAAVRAGRAERSGASGRGVLGLPGGGGWRRRPPGESPPPS